MNRRDFLQAASVVSARLAFSSPVERWRTFEVTTRIEVLRASGATRIWVPMALAGETQFQRTIKNTFSGEGGTCETIGNMIAAEFPAGVRPVLTVTSRAATRNWAVNLAAPSQTRRVNTSELNDFLRPTKMAPTDGIVKQRATEITKGARTDLDKARAIYEWIVENTYRNPKTRGCGTGDIRFMLESGDLGGKCADLNALYVGLARAVGLPARDVYGIRVAKSEMGCKSLGPATENVTKAQHCRAEVYLSEYGWVPVDPADVRKVMLEETPGNRTLDDEMVKQARARLFGSWEMNWMAYNFAQDVTLPGSSGAPVHFLMYPQAETADGRVDSLDPEGFRYEISAREVS
jgi:transglutaminase-like putative cysteine protease